MTIIPEVASTVTNITNAEFVKLTVYNDFTNTNNVSTYTFSSSYKDETIGGVNYLALGGLLQVGAQANDLRVTDGDTSVSLSGIDGNNINLVLSNKVKGSKLEISRGFYDDTFVLGNVYPRFNGIITGYTISEDRSNQDDNFTVVVNASSYKTVLENRVAGRFTNKESWRFFNPNDASMDNVYSIAGRSFDFGGDPRKYGYTSGGGGGGGGGGGDFGGGYDRREAD